MFWKKGVLRHFAKLTGKHLCQSHFFNKVAGLRPATLLKKRLWDSGFPVNFAKFLRTPSLQNTFGRLLLDISLTKTLEINSLEHKYARRSYLKKKFRNFQEKF